jgi:single-strand DNA-binding protein
MNKLILLGRLGQKPETTQRGEHTVCKFSVATTEREKTQWHSCVAFGKTAETIAKHFDKGQMISLEGRVEYSKHEDKYYTNIIVERFYFCGGGEKPKTDSEKYGKVAESYPQPTQAPMPMAENDLPF